ncbi:MAG TPA: MarR family transcriptional regulator [Bdellovibrionales bacterium]|nr:MarR family transcriptional regulator [Bdellovibrionales bacterium]
MLKNGETVDGSLKDLISIGLKIQAINKALEAGCGLSVVQWSVLRTLIERPAVSPQSLARALEVTPGTLTQTLQRLSRKRLVFICDDPKDARKKIVSITRDGRDLLTAAGEVHEQAFQGLRDAAPALSTLRRVLDERVIHRLEEKISGSILEP